VALDVDPAKPLSGNYNDRVNHKHNVSYHDLQDPWALA
jgi:hypothetical protein